MYFPKDCDCCGIGRISEPHEICEICGWEDDATQRNDPDFSGGANKLSLNEHRLLFNGENLENEDKD